MLKENRFDFILSELKKKKQLTYEWVAGQLDVSEDTIRRDIETLYKNGLLSKCGVALCYAPGTRLPSRTGAIT